MESHINVLQSAGHLSLSWYTVIMYSFSDRKKIYFNIILHCTIVRL